MVLAWFSGTEVLVLSAIAFVSGLLIGLLVGYRQCIT